MRKTVLLLILILLSVGALSTLAQDVRPTQSVTGVHVSKNITPTSFASMSRAERQAAAQALKDAESANAGPGFQGTLTTGTRHEASVSRTAAITITYDTGTFSTVGTNPAVADNFSFGNNFDTVNGGAIGGGKTQVTITQLTAFIGIIDGSTTGTGGAFVTIFGPPVGTSAPALTSPYVGSLQAGTFNVIAAGTTLTGTNVGFMAGVWNPGAGNGSGTDLCATDCVGFDTGTVGGQGFHGMAVEDLGGGNFTPSTNVNGMIRAAGNLIPVELMNFSVE